MKNDEIENSLETHCSGLTDGAKEKQAIRILWVKINFHKNELSSQGNRILFQKLKYNTGSLDQVLK